MTSLRVSVLILIAAMLVSCRTTGTSRQTMSNGVAGIGARVVCIEPASMWQVTAAPFRQAIVVDVTDDPSNLIQDRRVKLVILFGTLADAPFLRKTEGGIVIDERVVTRGTYLRAYPPFERVGTCPAPVLAGRFVDANVAGTYDDLPCYEMEVSSMAVGQ